MPRYYCDYCDTYLTHDSPSVRKQHNSGYKHKANVRIYYQQFEEQQTQSLIDQRIKEHLGQAAALQQVGAAYAAWQRARPPVLPTPMMPIPGLTPGAPLPPGIRPPVLPRPMTMTGPPVYGAPPSMAPPVSGGLQGIPMPTNGGPTPPTYNIPSSIPGSTTNPSPNVVPSPIMQPPMYHGAPGGPNFGTPKMAPLPTFPSATDSTTAPNNDQ
jgi:U1 small nuclear ribonucleoprotein C